MDYTLFAEFINRNQERDQKLELLENLGIDMLDFDNAYDFLVDQFLNAYWTEAGVEWIYWFMYDSEYGQKDWSKIDVVLSEGENGDYKEVKNKYTDSFGAHDSDGNPICYDTKSLYEYVKHFEKPVYEVIKNPVHVKNKKSK